MNEGQAALKRAGSPTPPSAFGGDGQPCQPLLSAPTALRSICTRQPPEQPLLKIPQAHPWGRRICLFVPCKQLASTTRRCRCNGPMDSAVPTFWNRRVGVWCELVIVCRPGTACVHFGADAGCVRGRVCTHWSGFATSIPPACGFRVMRSFGPFGAVLACVCRARTAGTPCGGGGGGLGCPNPQREQQFRYNVRGTCAIRSCMSNGLGHVLLRQSWINGKCRQRRQAGGPTSPPPGGFGPTISDTSALATTHSLVNVHLPHTHSLSLFGKPPVLT